MNRQEFMKRLEELLRGIPASEREDALAYYNDYFDEAGVENEAQVIMELGSPEIVAEKILADVQQESAQHTRQAYTNPEPEVYEETYTQQESQTSRRTTEKKKMNKSTKILLVLLLIATFPIWIGVVAGLFGGAVGIIGAVFGIVVGFLGAAFGLVVGGGACIIMGIIRFGFAPIEALASIGVGAVLTALGLLLAVPSVWAIGVWIPKGVKAFFGWAKGLLHRNKGGNEI